MEHLGNLEMVTGRFGEGRAVLFAAVGHADFTIPSEVGCEADCDSYERAYVVCAKIVQVLGDSTDKERGGDTGRRDDSLAEAFAGG
jgi:hypothetical protein